MPFCLLSKYIKANVLRSATGSCLLAALITIGFASFAFGQAGQAQQQQRQQQQQNNSDQIRYGNRPSAEATPSTPISRRPMTAEELAAWEAHQKRSAQAGAAQAAAPRSPQLPPGFPLPADEQQYVEKVLDYWQQTSDKVKHYKCDFLRYDYDTEFVNIRDPRTNQLYAHHQGTGEIRFAAPDKARFETTKVFKFTGAPKEQGGNAIYEPLKGHSMWGRTINECWVCTGQSVFSFDFEQKARHEEKIPPRLQGNVVESPLPFLFGAKKDDVMKRYWVRYIPKYETDAQGQKKLIENEIWLDIYPKRINDAQTYSKVELILSADDFMPLAIHMYAPNYNPAKNNYSSRYFIFQNRQINAKLDGLRGWMNRFVQVSVPPTWRKVDALNTPAQSAQRPAQQR